MDAIVSPLALRVSVLGKQVDVSGSVRKPQAAVLEDAFSEEQKHKSKLSNEYNSNTGAAAVR